MLSTNFLRMQSANYKKMLSTNFVRMLSTNFVRKPSSNTARRFVRRLHGDRARPRILRDWLAKRTLK
jgi:hypothetical protein